MHNAPLSWRKPYLESTAHHMTAEKWRAQDASEDRRHICLWPLNNGEEPSMPTSRCQCQSSNFSGRVSFEMETGRRLLDFRWKYRKLLKQMPSSFISLWRKPTAPLTSRCDEFQVWNCACTEYLSTNLSVNSDICVVRIFLYWICNFRCFRSSCKQF